MAPALRSADLLDQRAHLARILENFEVSQASLQAVLPLLGAAKHAQLRFFCSAASVSGYRTYTQTADLRSFVESWIRTKISEWPSSTAPPAGSGGDPDQMTDTLPSAPHVVEMQEPSFQVQATPQLVAFLATVPKVGLGAVPKETYLRALDLQEHIQTFSELQLVGLCRHLSISRANHQASVEEMRLYLENWFKAHSKLHPNETPTAASPMVTTDAMLAPTDLDVPRPPSQVPQPPQPSAKTSKFTVGSSSKSATKKGPTSSTAHLTGHSPWGAPAPTASTPRGNTQFVSSSLAPSDDLANYMANHRKQTTDLVEIVSSMVAFLTPALEDKPQFQHFLKIFEKCIQRINEQEMANQALAEKLLCLQAQSGTPSVSASPPASSSVPIFAGAQTSAQAAPNRKGPSKSKGNQQIPSSSDFPPLDGPSSKNNKIPTYKSALGSSGPKMSKKQSAVLKERTAHQDKVAAAKKALYCSERSFRLIPPTSGLSLVPISPQKFGFAIEHWFSDHLEDLSGRCLEQIRRDSKGNFFIQVKPTLCDKVKSCMSNTKVDLGPDLGEWQWLDPEPSPYKGLTPFVISGVPLDFDLNDFATELFFSNPDLDLDMHTLDDSISHPRRLDRRSQPGHNDWIPSLAVQFWVDENLATSLDSQCTLQWQWQSVSLRRYHQQEKFCSNCLKTGHFKKDCRSGPKCKLCSRPHTTTSCALYRGSPPKPPILDNRPLRGAPQARNGAKRRMLISTDGDGWTTIGSWDPSSHSNVDLSREAEAAPVVA